jgi:hypothetical protein
MKTYFVDSFTSEKFKGKPDGLKKCIQGCVKIQKLNYFIT